MKIFNRKKKKNTFMVFHMVGYDSKQEDQLTNRVDVSLIDDSYDNVLRRVKDIADRTFWFPVEITEFERGK